MPTNVTTLKDNSFEDLRLHHVESATHNNSSSFYSIVLNILRYTDSKRNWKIQALFDKDIIFDFDDGKGLTYPQTNTLKNKQTPFLYQLRLNVRIDHSGEISIYHKNNWHRMDTYRLRITQRHFTGSLRFEHCIIHSLTIGSLMSDQFIFDVQFVSRLTFQPPGSDIPFWNHLCIFTYFIIKDALYDQYNLLFEQFIQVLREKKKHFSQDDLKMFFQFCRAHFGSIENAIRNNQLALKILVHMIALLPLNSQNMTVSVLAAGEIASIVLNNLTDKLAILLLEIDEAEWLSFKEGLVKLFCIMLRCQELVKQTDNPVILLSQMTDATRRQETIIKLFILLGDLTYIRLEDRAMQLFQSVNPDVRQLIYLELADSLKTYITFLPLFVTAYQDDENQLHEVLTKHMEKLLQQNHFQIQLIDIVFILDYLKTKTDRVDDNLNVSAVKKIQFVLETSSILWDKVSQCLNERNYHFLLDDFPLIRDIIFRAYNQVLLQFINRKQFLLRTLSRRDDRTMEYYIAWFKYFLCEPHQIWMDYHGLLHQWTKCFVDDQKMFTKIMEQVDMLIEYWTQTEPHNDQHCVFFVTHMVEQCFRQGNIFGLLMNGLHSVKDLRFFDVFKHNFYKYQLVVNEHCLKQVYNSKNPLFQLMDIDNKSPTENTLVKELIALVMSMIKIDEQEIIRDTFHNPSRHTCTYAILFHKSLKSLPIQREIIHRLNIQLTKWEEGILASDILKWRQYSKENGDVFHKIWDLVSQIAGKSYQLDILFNNAEKAWKNNMEMYDKIKTCINAYCQQASDKNTYDEILKAWHEHFQSQYIQPVIIPTRLIEILRFANKLNAYAEVLAWRKFLDQQTRMRGLRMPVEQQQQQEIDDEVWTKNDLSSTSSDRIQFEIETYAAAFETVDITCLHLLRRVEQNFEQFHDKLKHHCAVLLKAPIEQLLCLFPNIQQAEKDLKLLVPLLDPVTLPLLRSIVLFWLNRFRVNNICMGLMNLSTIVSFTIDTPFLCSVCNINEKTLGETCVSIYEKYQNQFEQRFSKAVLLFISYYGSSLDLFDFLHSLIPDDIYNLQEAVNDWDETLVNTKTVFDFATIKNFIDRTYAAIKVKRQALVDVPLQLEQIITCFEDVWKDDQFTDLLQYLESSSLALSSIKRIYLELTDKEQSKRRQIADILQQSTIDFVYKEHQETIFDVNVKHLSQKRTSNEEKKQQSITFTDLSDLRDRIRLLEYSSNVNKRDISEADKEKLRNFIQLTSVIESSLKSLTILYTAGHSSVSEFIAPRKTFSCIDGRYDELLNSNTMLISLLGAWEEKLCTFYEKYVDLTYFSGDQFRIIEDYIYNQTLFSHPGYHLLKFIGIDPNLINKPTRLEQEPENQLENLGCLLAQQRQMSPLQEESSKLKSILLVETTNEGILRAILSLFSLTKTSVSLHHVFYCDSCTNWIQVRAFIYRCFYSQSFYQLVRPERLSQSIQDQFIGLLRSLMKQRPHQTFRIGVITTIAPTNSQLINGLQSMQVLNELRDQELLNKADLEQHIKRLIQNCTLVTSRIAGLGKSSVIRQIIARSKKKYFKFSIYGDFDCDTLAERLCSKSCELETGAIHLDIGPTNNIQQLNEVLYCLVLFRSFQFGHIAVSIPAETPIYIELDASFQSILTEVTLFQHLHYSSIFLDGVNWNTLDVENDQVQTVANYLQAIESQRIIQQNVNASTFIPLDVSTCSQLIQKHFKNKDSEYVTWTQLSIFIAVFNRLFTGFSCCGYFFREYVPYPKLRMNLVQTLLQSSNQFTSVSVKAIREQQQSITTNESVTFSDAIIRWDKMQPFTLIFTATDEPLFVYKTPTNVPPALVEYFKAYNKEIKRQGRIKEKEIFPDYNKLTHAELFIRLASLSRKYFNKAICPDCFGQYNIQQQRCDICSSTCLVQPKSLDHIDVTKFQIEIARKLELEYALTPDNFIKMLLIYMRVLSGIPILIMGETGNKVFHINHITFETQSMVLLLNVLALPHVIKLASVQVAIRHFVAIFHSEYLISLKNHHFYGKNIGCS